MDFKGFPKIPRLRRGIVITEKIDGTNASVYIPEDDGPVLAGCRTRWITPEKDNYGFAAWVRDNEAQLRSELGPGRHFGEWWGNRIQRNYNLSERRFSLFNIATHQNLSICHLVPLLYIGDWSDEAINTCLSKLKEEGSMAAPGFMNPEGIVIFHSASNGLYKLTLKDDDRGKGWNKELSC